MEKGTKVEVRSQFDRSWSDGFVVEETFEEVDLPVSYRVKRLSDGMVLPRGFAADEVRHERRGGTWWYRM